MDGFLFVGVDFLQPPAIAVRAALCANRGVTVFTFLGSAAAEQQRPEQQQQHLSVHSRVVVFWVVGEGLHTSCVDCTHVLEGGTPRPGAHVWFVERTASNGKKQLKVVNPAHPFCAIFPSAGSRRHFLSTARTHTHKITQPASRWAPPFLRAVPKE